jgi:Neuraminidase (sialidase)
VPFGSIIEALDGLPAGAGRARRARSLLVSMYYRPASTNLRTVIVARSTDEGKTWSEYGTVAALAPGHPDWVGSEGCSEVDFVRLKDKRIYAVFRTGSGGFLGHTWSKDDGRTWSEPMSMGFRGVDPHLATLCNGMLALSTGRPDPVGVRFSPKGDGTDWSAPLEIFGGIDTREHGLNKRRSTRYTDVLEVEPGRLIVVYDSVPYGWDPIPSTDAISKNSIMATFVEYDV